MNLSCQKYTPILLSNGKLDKKAVMQNCSSGFTTVQNNKVMDKAYLQKLGDVLQNYVVYSNIIWKNNHRSKTNAIFSNIDMLIFDIDSGMNLDEIHSLVDYRIMTLTTTSHTPQQHKFRVIIPLDKKISFNSEEEYSELLKLFNKEHLNSKADVACLEAGRAYITTPSAKYKIGKNINLFNPDALLKQARFNIVAKQITLNLKLEFASKNTRTKKVSIEDVMNYPKVRNLVAQFSRGNHHKPVYQIIGIGKTAGLSNEECAYLIMQYKLGNEYENFDSLIKKAQKYDS